MLFFEDFTPGQTDSYGRYEVSREEVLEFATKYDPQPFHLDDEAAEKGLFGTLTASGWHTCAMTMRMLVDRMKEAGGASLGSPGVDQLRWIKPVVPGDVLSVRNEILSVKRSKSRPGIGTVSNKVTTMNAKGEAVMEFLSVGFYPCRDQAGG